MLVACCPEVQGYCWLAKSRDADAPPGTAELIAVYVAPDFARSGLGRALIVNGIAAALQHAFRRLTLWALDQNTLAHAFYRCMGFELDGCDKTTLRWGGSPLRELRFARGLDAKPLASIETGS